jgi:hypothetical protein
VYYGFGGGCCAPATYIDTTLIFETEEGKAEYEMDGNKVVWEEYGPGESAEVTYTRSCWKD